MCIWNYKLILPQILPGAVIKMSFGRVFDFRPGQYCFIRVKELDCLGKSFRPINTITTYGIISGESAYPCASHTKFMRFSEQLASLVILTSTSTIYELPYSR